MTDTEPKPATSTTDAATVAPTVSPFVTEAEIVPDPDPETAVTEPDRAPARPDPQADSPVAPVSPPLRPEPPADPAPQRKSGSTLGGIVIGAVLAVGAGFAAQQYLPPQTGFDPAPLEARLSAAETEAQALRAEIARLTEAQAAAPLPDPTLADRLAALETAGAPDLAPLTDRLDAVEAQLSALADLPTRDGTGVSAAALAALQTDVAALQARGNGPSADLAALASEVEARLTEAEAKAGELTAQASAIAAEAARNAALAQIGAAFDSGLPYRAALTALGDAEIPEAIALHADTGLPSVATLRAAFPETARAALEQALRANPGETWTERVGSYLRNQTGARSLAPRDGTDPDAVLSRAEAALVRADVAGALTELGALPPEAQAALADWSALAQQRLDAQAALAGLLQGAGQ